MAGKMILLYAHPGEVKYVYYEPKMCIGVGATQLENVELCVKNFEFVILFGSSGWLGSRKNAPINQLITKTNFLYVPEPVHDDKWIHHFRYFKYYLVDMESYQVKNMCDKYNINFKSIRYVIDFCDKKVMPIGINHFWRKWQHKRMQEKFNELIIQNKVFHQ